MNLRRKIIASAICVTVLAIVWMVWHLRTRNNVIQAVDDTTAAPLPIETDIDLAFVDLADPTLNYALWSPDVPGNDMLGVTTILNVRWSRPLRIFVSSKGYDKVPVIVDDDSPTLIIVPLHKKEDTK